MRIRRILLNNIGLKALAFFLAFVTWFYVGEVTGADPDKTVLQKILASSRFVGKRLTVQPDFSGSLPEGYRLLKSEIKVTPEYVIVLGPSKILSVRNSIRTKPIDLAEYTQTKTLDVELEDISRSIKSPKIKIQVHLPVKKLEPDKTAAE